MTEQNKMPEIKVGDLIEIRSEIYDMTTATSEKYIKQIYSVKALTSEDVDVETPLFPALYIDESDVGRLYYEMVICGDYYYNEISFVNQGSYDIVTIYRKQGKDYICIWERNI